VSDLKQNRKVLTKKENFPPHKLDQHKNRCYGAVFTCLDCNTTFQGNDYRQHTSCISEDQKYQKGLYKEKKKKGGEKKQQQQAEVSFRFARTLASLDLFFFC
jgi:hypothetical protein